MSDLRKEPRKKLMAFTPVYGTNKRSLLGYVANLTLQGAMIVGENAIEIGREVNLRIEFPGDLPYIIPTDVSLPARAAWCRPDENPQDFNIGFEFKDLSPEQRRLITAILERYQFRHDMPSTEYKPR